MAAVWMQFKSELCSRWRSWLTLAVLAGVAGGLAVAAAAGARRTDSALARHLVAYRIADVAVESDNGSSWRDTFDRVGTLPQVGASAVTAELAYCGRDAHDRPLIDVGPQAVGLWVGIDGRDGVAFDRRKILAGRRPDPTRPRELLLDSRAADRFGVRPGDVIPIRVFPSFDRQTRVFRCDPDSNSSAPGIPQRREVRQILVACPEPRPCNEARALAERLYARLRDGADFSYLARKHSDDPAAPDTGGRMWIAHGETVEPFQRKAFGLATGTISRPLRTKYGWHLVQPLSEIVPVGRRIDLKVVGIKAATDPAPIGNGMLTPAFDRTYRFASLYFSYQLRLRLEHGAADLPALQAELNKIQGVAGVELERSTAAKIQRSIHNQAQGLWFAAAFGALLALVLLAQALLRLASFAVLEHPTLRALGMTRKQLVGVGIMRAGTIAVVAAASTAALAFALSALTPIGLARELEPTPGFSLDVRAVGVGIAALLAAVVLVGALAAWRADWTAARVALRPSGSTPVADVLATWGLPVTVVTGVRFALGRGRGPTATPVGATLFGGILAVTVTATALTFSSSLDHLFSTPRLYGQNWDYRSEYCCDTVHTAKIRADPSISDAAWGTDKDSLLLNGRSVGVLAMDNIKGRIAPVVTEGRAPVGPGEILLAGKTLGALALDLGDSVEVRGHRTARMRVVGRGVIPEGTFNELGKGVAMTFSAFRRVQPGAVPYVIRVRIAPGADRAATFAELENQFVAPVPGPPKTVAEGVRGLALVVSALLAALAAGVLAHTLVMAVRRRRRDLAILKALGFDRRQVVATVSWQATTFAAIALLVGLPLGVAAGRWAWNLFAEQIGVVPEAVTPVGLILLVAPATLVLANLVALLPGRIASRTRPALVLRAE